MSRSLWFVAGAGAGVWAVQRARRAAEALTAGGLRDRLQALDHGARLVAAEVAAGRAEKEAELRERLGLVPPTTPALEAGPPPTDAKELP
ncbi:DUF6167 family protein [Nocardioides perillae]|uniref:Secreted protein n=1 Tax=Nocardioides perillae TaxID=1119534 RepID=A0A7Y9UL54_9ACTN|nr:DUF6167 family protein [Nocardioides perillae]NYG56083.1 hypothetical protein [Nocardioides perillae]